MSRAELFTIRQMIDLTGLSEYTIRGWETRYSAFQPRRSATGRRGYVKKDVERALLLRELLKRGYRIGALAGATNPDLKSLFEQSEADRKTNFSQLNQVNDCLSLVALQKWDELEVSITNLRHSTIAQFINEFFMPFVRALSNRIDNREISIAQEHIVSSYIKEKIYSMILKMRKKVVASDSVRRGRFVLATPEGDYHESALLLAHALLQSKGCKSLYLGPHTPASELCKTALNYNATHVFIVATVSQAGGAKHEPFKYVAEVQRRIGSSAQILFAGREATIRTTAIPGLTILDSFQSLESYINKKGRNSG